MNVLVINAGSSSLKYQLLDVDTREVFAKGNCERIGLDGAFVGHEEQGAKKVKTMMALPNHKVAAKYVLDLLDGLGLKIDGIGHRIVQGGWYFPDSAIVTDETLGWVREVAPLAPLHNYAEADVIDYCRERMPQIGNIVVCDTSFHLQIPEEAHRYALPRDVVDKLHIRKYGAHGTSHRYIWRETDAFTNHQVHKLVSCHIGSGASLSAIKDGHDMDTTMGLTPLDGLVMGTRCGSIDPATVVYLQREGGYSADAVDDMMNKQSGLLALSGRSSDMRDVQAGVDEGDENCQVAFDCFTYRASLLVAEMAQAMQGFDTMAFSAGVGENAASVRADICRRLGWLGVKIDDEKNEVHSGETRDISAADSKIRVLIVPTDEEYMIALDVKRLLG
ncbi:MAG: acetate kinase [Atopobiaceae bacterium]|jgi:acetate kinase|nr:acetate kinase [Atopobiaceae bacterium]MCH4180117.1 acetate kinase [Atopobiaceae bacterium]MCH4213831.1 acetate kinase [Atopobiaceae bacterium]MCH4229933.1 acetate kinase [Atopobiaceae bacterium]MCH4275706.1 acetate kinase [Atopobiaceae bacterium]